MNLTFPSETFWSSKKYYYSLIDQSSIPVQIFIKKRINFLCINLSMTEIHKFFVSNYCLKIISVFNLSIMQKIQGFQSRSSADSYYLSVQLTHSTMYWYSSLPKAAWNSENGIRVLFWEQKGPFKNQRRFLQHIEEILFEHKSYLNFYFQENQKKMQTETNIFWVSMEWF